MSPIGTEGSNPSPSSGESDGLQIKGIAQNSCRARFDAH
jgi:hypothetical protein